MKVAFVTCIALASASFASNHDHLLPGATILKFDHTKKTLNKLNIDTLDSPCTGIYTNIDIYRFRRIPISVELPQSASEIPALMMLTVDFSFLDDTDQFPVLLLYRKHFGGHARINYDSSNFCDWAEKHGNSALPISTRVSMFVELTRSNLFGTKRSTIDLVLYVGFSGKRVIEQTVSFKVQASLQSLSIRSDLPNINHACTVLENEKAPYALHHQKRLNRSTLPGVVAPEIVVRHWRDVPPFPQKPTDLKLNAVVQDDGRSLVLLGVDFPKKSLKVKTEPILSIEGLRSTDMLFVGSYDAQSIWEFQEIPLIDILGKTVVIQLANITDHMSKHMNLLSTSSSAVLIAIIPRSGLETSSNTSAELRSLSIYPSNGAVLPPSDLKDSAVIESVSDTMPSDVVQVSNYALLYAHIVRTILFTALGTSALIGIVRGCYLIISRLDAVGSRRPIHCLMRSLANEETRQLAGADLEKFYHRQMPLDKRHSPDCDRTKLLPNKDQSIHFDIASTGVD